MTSLLLLLAGYLAFVAVYLYIVWRTRKWLGTRKSKDEQ